MTEVQLCFASGPRHVALMAGLAATAPDATSVLVHVDHYPADVARRYLAALGDVRPAPFDRVVELSSDYRPLLGDARGLARKLAKYRLRRGFQERNAATLRALVDELAPSTVYTCSDGSYEAHLGLHLARCARPDGRRVFVEEGTSAYDHTFHERPAERLGLRALRNASKRLTLGRWWRPGAVLGTSPYVDETLAAFPELVVDELRRRPVRPLPPDVLRGPRARDLALALARRAGADLDAVRGAGLVVALTTSWVAHDFPGYAEAIRNLCTELLAAGHGVLVKCHPREREPGFVDLPDHPDLAVLPPGLLFENLIVLNENPDLAVLGDVSTALLATRWLRPEVRVVALRHPSRRARARTYLQAAFEALGIPIEDDPARAAARLRPAATGALGR